MLSEPIEPGTVRKLKRRWADGTIEEIEVYIDMVITSGKGRLVLWHRLDICERGLRAVRTVQGRAIRAFIEQHKDI